MPKKMTFDEWKAAVQKASNDLGCPDNLWADGDPYDLAEVAKTDFESGFSPESFVREVFADDIAASEGNESQFVESLDGYIYGEED